MKKNKKNHSNLQTYVGWFREHLAQNVPPTVTLRTLENVDLSNVPLATLEKLKDLQKQIDELYEVILKNQREMGKQRILIRET